MVFKVIFYMYLKFLFCDLLYCVRFVYCNILSETRSEKN